MAVPFDIDNIPLDIELDDVDTLDEYIDYSDIEAKYAVHVADQFDTILVIDGVPVVDEDKKDKLLTVIRKQFVKEGVSIKQDGFIMPMEQSKGKLMSKGCVSQHFHASLYLVHHESDSNVRFRLKKILGVKP
jgi:translation initiation factor 3 subunit B